MAIDSETRELLERLGARFAALCTEVTTLRDGVGALRDEVDTLRDEVGALRVDVRALEVKLDRTVVEIRRHVDVTADALRAGR